MKRWVLFAISMAGLAAALTAAQDDGLPAGKGKDVLQRMCTTCHGLDQVVANRYSKKAWADLVDDMVSRGAEGSGQDIEAVVSYLSRNFGQKVEINAASAKDLQTGLSFTAAEAEAVVKYRNERGNFKMFDDLAKVPGIRADLLEEQKSNIVF
jgi:competence ComEA-like helix-hairpin-helix protein